MRTAALCVLVAVTAVRHAAALRIVHLSDIHLDPDYGTPLGVGPCTTPAVNLYNTTQCDTSPAMMEMTIKHLRSIAIASGEPTLLVYTGDWIRHGTSDLPNRTLDMPAIFESVARNLSSTNLSIGGLSIGNEDYVPDYNATADNPFVALYAPSLLVTHLLTPLQVQSFAKCAYYASPHPSLGLTILTLNTVLYSPHDKNPISDPCGQLVWLERELAAADAAGMKVLIAGHIPPKLDLWRPDVVGAFSAVIARHSGIIIAQLYGHTHATLITAEDDTSMPPVIIGGSITRISRTNPCFQVYTLDPTSLTITDWVQHIFFGSSSPPAWSGQTSVKAAFGLANITSTEINAMLRRLVTDKTLLEPIFTLLNGGLPEPALDKICATVSNAFCQLGISCALRTDSIEAAVKCIITGGGGRATEAEARRFTIRFLGDFDMIRRRGEFIKSP